MVRPVRAGSRREARASQRSAAPFACRLVVLVKEPVAGRVKTRLAREVGAVQAASFYRATARALIARLDRQPFWETWVAVAPDRALKSRMLPKCARRMPQGGGDIGERMQRPMRRLPPGPVCVIGTDIPGIRVAHLRRAFRLLGTSDAVFGPAEDGGFWLVGLKRAPGMPEPYSGVRWSSPEALSDTLANLDGWRVGFTTTLADVDSAADFERERHRFGRRVRPAWEGERKGQ